MDKETETVDKGKVNKKNIVLIVFIVTSIYICYTVFLLIKQPTDTFMIEEGEVYQEETDIRIYN